MMKLDNLIDHLQEFRKYYPGLTEIRVDPSLTTSTGVFYDTVNECLVLCGVEEWEQPPMRWEA